MSVTRHCIPYKARAAVLLALAIAAPAVYLSSCARTLTYALSPFESLSIKKASVRTDFYSAANRDWLLAHRVPPKGYIFFDSFMSVDRDNNDDFIAILDSLDPASLPSDSPERKVATLYRTYLDLEGRDKRGVEPIKKHLEAFERASTLEGLMDADLACFRETGISCLLRFESGQNDAGIPMLFLYGPSPSRFDVYRGGKNERAYLRYLADLFSLAGYDRREASSRAKKVFAFEKGLRAYAPSAEKEADPANTVWYPFYLFRTLYPNIDFRKHFEAMGFTVPEGVFISNQRVMEEAAKKFSDEGRETLALYAEKTLLDTCGNALSTDFQKALVRLRTTVFGYDEGMDAADYWKLQALSAVKYALPSQLGETFVHRMVPPKARSDAQGIVDRIASEYPRFIEGADWLDGRTKEKALAKLGAIRKRVAYPDSLNRDYDGVTLLAPGEGGTLFGNATALRLRYAQIMRERLGKPLDRAEWPIDLPVYTVNAFYSRSTNSVFVLGGILRPPFYDPEKSESWNLGGIGVVIAHEISHAFDTNGSKIDENGRARTWWVKGDYEKYDARCDRVRAYYDGAKGAYGARDNGALTASENVSDIMAMQCALAVLKKTANPDYREFFTAFATCFRRVSTPETEYYLSKTDPHSLPRPRVNRAVANFAEFQEAFAVEPGDPMYVAPEDRVSVW